MSFDNCSSLLLFGVGVNLRPLDKTEISCFDNFLLERLKIFTDFLPVFDPARLAVSISKFPCLCFLPINPLHCLTEQRSGYIKTSLVVSVVFVVVLLVFAVALVLRY